MKRWDGVADGTRTHDDQNHNLGLYQLSYSHQSAAHYTALGQGAEAAFRAWATTSALVSAL